MSERSPSCPQCGRMFRATSLGAVCPACLMEGLWEEAAPPVEGLLLAVPGYEVRQELGRGGMGIVYLARELDPPREVALKMLLPVQSLSEGMKERFRLEAATVAALDHPHILPVYAAGEHDGLPWFTLKLARGGTLAERGANLTGRWREIAALMVTVAEAVHFAHQRGVLHRDIKPGNVIFDEQGTVYVCDFGLAKWLGPSLSGSHALTQEGTAMGTPHYLAPEAARHGAAAATAASDLYALGAVLYELLAGRPPFMAESTPELMRRIYEEPGVPPWQRHPDVPRDLSAVTMKCIEKDPAQRYGSALALAADLKSWLAGRGVEARPVPARVRLGRWARRNPALTAMAALLLLALTTAAVLQVQSQQRLRRSLGESLLNQARLTAMGWEQGARNATVRLLREADQVRASLPPLAAAQRATEIAHAMAMPELLPVDLWAAPSLSSEGSECFSADLKRYLAATPEGGFALHDATSRAVLKTWPGLLDGADGGHRSALRMQLSPDEKWASVIFEGDVETPALLQVIGLGDGQVVAEWPCDPGSRGFPLWLPDGGFLYAGKRTACLRADAGGINLRPFPDAGRAAEVLPLALHPDGTRVVVAWKTEKALAVLTLPGGVEEWRMPLQNLPGPVAWSADGRLLAVGEQMPATRMEEDPLTRTGYGILLVEAASGAVRTELPGHDMGVTQVCFLRKSESVASIGADQVMIWQEARSGGFRLTAQAQPRLLQTDRTGHRLVWSPAQGSLSMAQTGWPVGWQLWEDETGGEATCTVTAGEGSRLYLTTREDLQIWDTATRRRLHRQAWPPGFPRSWPWFVVTRDGREIIMGDRGQPLHVIPVQDSAEGTPLAGCGTPVPRGPGETFHMIHSLSPDGGWVVCDSPAGRGVQRGRTFSVWPQGDPARARVVARGIAASTMFLLGPEGRWALGAARSGRDCGIWDVREAKYLGTAGIDEAVGVSASPDHRFAVLTGRSRLALWEADRQQFSASWEAPPGVGGTLGQFSPDSRRLAVYDRKGSIHVYQVPEGRLVFSLVVPGGFSFRDVQWAGPRRLIGMGTDGRIGEWDLDRIQDAAAAAGLPWEEK